MRNVSPKNFTSCSYIPFCTLKYWTKIFSKKKKIGQKFIHFLFTIIKMIYYENDNTLIIIKMSTIMKNIVKIIIPNVVVAFLMARESSSTLSNNYTQGLSKYTSSDPIGFQFGIHKSFLPSLFSFSFYVENKKVRNPIDTVRFFEHQIPLDKSTTLYTVSPTHFWYPTLSKILLSIHKRSPKNCVHFYSREKNKLISLSMAPWRLLFFTFYL